MKNWITELFKSTTPVYLEIRGRETLLLQGCCRIKLYSAENMVLSNGDYTVSVLGEGLELRHLSEDTVAVDGRIDCIEFL